MEPQTKKTKKNCNPTKKQCAPTFTITCRDCANHYPTDKEPAFGEKSQPFTKTEFEKLQMACEFWDIPYEIHVLSDRMEEMLKEAGITNVEIPWTAIFVLQNGVDSW